MALCLLLIRQHHSGGTPSSLALWQEVLLVHFLHSTDLVEECPTRHIASRYKHMP